MLKSFRDHLKLAKLQSRRRKTIEYYAEQLRTMPGDDDLYPQMSRAAAHETEWADFMINQHITNSLRTQAEDLFIPIPSLEEKDLWVEFRASEVYHLSPKAVNELRSAIRKERRERWDYWATRATSLTGLIGALIGLIAVFKK